MSLRVFYTLEVKDKNGKTVSKVTKPCHSFTIAMLQLIEVQSFGYTNVNIRDILNSVESVKDDAGNLESQGIIGNVGVGIVVGTGTTPVTNTDYVMEALIAHGVGAGQLSYGAGSKVTTAEVGVNVDLQKIRTFSNTSGGTINVTEIGIHSEGISVASHDFLTLHEIVTLTAVANGQTLTVTITYRTTV